MGRATGLALLSVVFCGIFNYPYVSGEGGCNGAASCELGCVSIERVLHRYGLDASASVLVAVPRLTNNYVLCYSRPLNSQKKSYVYCFYGSMDSLPGAQPRTTLIADGFVTRIQAIQVEHKQFLAIFALNRSPVLYDLEVRQNSLVSLSNPLELPTLGATDSALTLTQNVAIFATSSGRLCKLSDVPCISPSVAMINGRTGDLKRCETGNMDPAEYVTSWTFEGQAFLATAALVKDDAYLYKVELWKIVEESGAKCGLVKKQDVMFGRPVCGIQSMKMVKTKEQSFALVIVSRPCPALEIRDAPASVTQQSSAIIQWWNANTGAFETSNAEELPGSQKVTDINLLSKDLFVLQKDSEPSVILSSSTPVGSRLMVTVRLNDQAEPSAAQSANGDTYFTHVTSTGAVVIDWISCAVNQHVPSNYTLTRYGGNRYFESVADADNSSYSIENSILANIDSQSALRRLDRDSPKSWKVRHQDLPPNDLKWVGTNSTTANTTANNATLHYEELTRDAHEADLHPVGLTSVIYGGNPNFDRPEVFQRRPEPMRSDFEMNGNVLPPHPPPQFQQQPPRPPPPQNSGPLMAPQQNGWQPPQLPYQVPQYQQQVFQQQAPPQMMYSPPNYNGGSPYPFMSSYGGSQQMPQGSTLAGYFTFPPVAIFAPVPGQYSMPPNANPQYPYQEQNMQQQNSAPPPPPPPPQYFAPPPPQYFAPPPPQPENNPPPQWSPMYGPPGPQYQMVQQQIPMMPPPGSFESNFPVRQFTSNQPTEPYQPSPDLPPWIPAQPVAMPRFEPRQDQTWLDSNIHSPRSEFVVVVRPETTTALTAVTSSAAVTWSPPAEEKDATTVSDSAVPSAKDPSQTLSLTLKIVEATAAPNDGVVIVESADEITENVTDATTTDAA